MREIHLFDVKNDRHNDMPPYSKTFIELPEELQNDPTSYRISTFTS